MIKDGLVDIDDISVLKEAEKCASKLCCTDCKAVICEEKCECWTFAKKGVEFGYNKANEWHKVADGDLPKNRRNVYVAYLNGHNEIVTTIASFRHKFWVFDGHKTECEIIAWCELPKYIEE